MEAPEKIYDSSAEVTYEDLEDNSTEHHDKMEFIEDFKSYMEKMKYK